MEKGSSLKHSKINDLRVVYKRLSLNYTGLRKDDLMQMIQNEREMILPPGLAYCLCDSF